MRSTHKLMISHAVPRGPLTSGDRLFYIKQDADPPRVITWDIPSNLTLGNRNFVREVTLVQKLCDWDGPSEPIKNLWRTTKFLTGSERPSKSYKSCTKATSGTKF